MKGNLEPGLTVDNSVDTHRGIVWNRLHSEREEICEALLKESAPNGEISQTTPMYEDATRTARWHSDLLQTRLCKIDDALDRLLSGSYGNCSKMR